MLLKVLGGIQTNPGAGWFVYFRIYDPEQAAFDKT
jgi:hypothetical protein